MKKIAFERILPVFNKYQKLYERKMISWEIRNWRTCTDFILFLLSNVQNLSYKIIYFLLKIYLSIRVFYHNWYIRYHRFRNNIRIYLEFFFPFPFFLYLYFIFGDSIMSMFPCIVYHLNEFAHLLCSWMI